MNAIRAFAILLLIQVSWKHTTAQIYMGENYLTGSGYYNTTVYLPAAKLECLGLASIAESHLIAGDSTGLSCNGRSSCQSISLNDSKWLSTGTSSLYIVPWGFLSNAYVHDLNMKSITSTVGEAALYGSSNVTIKFMKCFSFNGCRNVNNMIVRETGVSYGAFSFYNSSVSSIGTNTSIPFYFHSFYGGYNSKITCTNGDNCTLSCKVNSCYNLEFECQNTDKSLCSVKCDSNGTICPNNWHPNGSYIGNINNITMIYGYGDYNISRYYQAYNVLANVLANGTKTLKWLLGSFGENNELIVMYFIQNMQQNIIN